MPMFRDDTTPTYSTDGEFSYEDPGDNEIDEESSVSELPSLVVGGSLDSRSSSEVDCRRLSLRSTESENGPAGETSLDPRSKTAILTKSSDSDLKLSSQNDDDVIQQEWTKRTLCAYIVEKPNKSRSENTARNSGTTWAAASDDSIFGRGRAGNKTEKNDEQADTNGLDDEWSTADSKSVGNTNNNKVYKSLSADLMAGKKNYTFTRAQLWEIAKDNKFIDSRLQNLAQRKMSPEFYNNNIRQVTSSSEVNRRKEDRRIQQANKTFYSHLNDIGAGKNRRNLSFGKHIDLSKVKKKTKTDDENVNSETNPREDGKYVIQENFKF